MLELYHSRRELKRRFFGVFGKFMQKNSGGHGCPPLLDLLMIIAYNWSIRIFCSDSCKFLPDDASSSNDSNRKSNKGVRHGIAKTKANKTKAI